MNPIKRGKEMAGFRSGRALAIKFSHSERKKSYWVCICDCGKEFVTPGRCLRDGSTQSCGCLGKERRAIATSKAKTTHGETRGGKSSRTYRIWVNMISRCTNPKFDSYPWYGGRGISVCDRWRLFQNFLDDMGHAPDFMTIDREDPNGNYELKNCRWATWTEQQNNRRDSKHITFQGKTLTQSQWARELNLDAKLISARLKRGWEVWRAFGFENGVQLKELESEQ